MSASFDPPPTFDDAPLGPRREHVVPVLSMANALLNVRADLGDERACASALKNAYLASDISAGLQDAIEQAREIKAGSDTVLSVARDLVCVGIFLASLFAVLPARAAEVEPYAGPHPAALALFAIFLVLLAGAFAVDMTLTRRDAKRRGAGSERRS